MRWRCGRPHVNQVYLSSSCFSISIDAGSKSKAAYFFQEISQARALLSFITFPDSEVPHLGHHIEKPERTVECVSMPHVHGMAKGRHVWSSPRRMRLMTVSIANT